MVWVLAAGLLGASPPAGCGASWLLLVPCAELSAVCWPAWAGSSRATLYRPVLLDVSVSRAAMQPEPVLFLHILKLAASDLALLPGACCAVLCTVLLLLAASGTAAT